MMLGAVSVPNGRQVLLAVDLPAKRAQLAHIHASFGPVTCDLRPVPGAFGSRLLGDRRGILTCTVFPNTGCTSGTLVRLGVEGACRHFLWSRVGLPGPNGVGGKGAGCTACLRRLAT